MKQTYVFKAQWDATAIHIRVTGTSVEDATTRAENQVKRMEGGVYCQKLTLLEIR